MTSKNTITNQRFYTVIIIIAVIGWTSGYFHGKTTTENKESDNTIAQQEKVLDVYTEIYGKRVADTDIFKWLHDHTD